MRFVGITIGFTVQSGYSILKSLKKPLFSLKFQLVATIGVQIPVGLRSLILEAPPRSPMEATRFCEACLWTLSFRFDDTGAKPSVCFFGVF